MKERNQFSGIKENLRLALYPKERERHKAQVFADRFRTIRDDLAKMKCSLEWSGFADVQLFPPDGPWYTTIELEGPKAKEAQIMELIGRSKIKLPDQEWYRQAQLEVLGDMVLQGRMTPKELKKAANTTKIYLFCGAYLPSTFKASVNIP